MPHNTGMMARDVVIRGSNFEIEDDPWMTHNDYQVDDNIGMPKSDVGREDNVIMEKT